MKSAITAICLHIPLGLIFIMIGSKFFYSSVDAAIHEKTMTKKESTTEATIKPVEKPIQYQAVESELVTEPRSMTNEKPIKVKLDEAKSVAETKPAKENTSEKNPVEAEPIESRSIIKTKPVETKPVTESNIREETAAPSVISVVTAEEAEKMNSFSIFLSSAKTTVVEGEIIERSTLPDPAKSDYPNCRFSAHFIGKRILSGQRCPQEISLSIEGFLNYTILENDRIKAGDKVLCTLIPFDQLPEDEQNDTAGG